MPRPSDRAPPSRFLFAASIVPAARFASGESGFVASFRDVPGCHTQGEDMREALANAADALEEAIAALLVHDRPIPVPSRPRRGERLIAVPAQTAAKAALRMALADAGISKSELARRLGCDEKDVRRLLDPRYGSKMPAMSQAMLALGMQFALDTRDAA